MDRGVAEAAGGDQSWDRGDGEGCEVIPST